MQKLSMLTNINAADPFPMTLGAVKRPEVINLKEKAAQEHQKQVLAFETFDWTNHTTAKSKDLDGFITAQRHHIFNILMDSYNEFKSVNVGKFSGLFSRYDFLTNIVDDETLDYWMSLDSKIQSWLIDELKHNGFIFGRTYFHPDEIRKLKANFKAVVDPRCGSTKTKETQIDPIDRHNRRCVLIARVVFGYAETDAENQFSPWSTVSQRIDSIINSWSAKCADWFKEDPDLAQYLKDTAIKQLQPGEKTVNNSIYCAHMAPHPMYDGRIGIAGADGPQGCAGVNITDTIAQPSDQITLIREMAEEMNGVETKPDSLPMIDDRHGYNYAVWHGYSGSFQQWCSDNDRDPETGFIKS